MFINKDETILKNKSNLLDGNELRKSGKFMIFLE